MPKVPPRLPLKIRAVSLTPEAERELERLQTALGRRRNKATSASAVVRALLSQRVSLEALAFSLAREEARGVVWGPVERESAGGPGKRRRPR